MFSSRITASFLNLIASTVFVGATCAVFLYLWYPGPYFEIAGGDGILTLLICVNLVLGPVATCLVFDPNKPKNILKNDIQTLLILQAGALIYGVSVAADARPVALVFAKDRYSLVVANEVRYTELRRLSDGRKDLPWVGGPVMLSIRSSTGSEVLDAVILASKGFDLATRPSYWQGYEQVAQDVFSKGRSTSELVHRYRLDPRQFEKDFLSGGNTLQNTAFLPLEVKSGGWSVLVNVDGAIVGFAPFDGFF